MNTNAFENLKKKVFCHFCERDSTKKTHILCRECENVNMCLSCFVQKKSNQVHEPTHRYSVIERLDFSLKSKDWSAFEELLLLDAVEKFGYGNWTEIQKYIGGKTREEIEAHFAKFYPLLTKKNSKEEKNMEKNLKKVKWSSVVFSEVKKVNGGKETSNLYTNKTLIKTGKGELMRKESSEFGPKISRLKSPSRVNPILRNLHFGLNENKPVIIEPFKSLFERIMQEHPDILLKLKESKNGERVKQLPVPESRNLLGYMHLRNEFEVEYNNDAELYIADLEFKNDDSAEDIKIKYSVLEIYNARLEERLMRKKFVVDHNLLNLEELFLNDKQMSPEERLFRNLAKSQLPFLTKKAFEDLIKCFASRKKFEKYKQQLIKFKNSDLRKGKFGIVDQNAHKSDEGSGLGGCSRRMGGGAQKPIFDNEELEMSVFEEEKRLCVETKIDFDSYLMMKEFLIRKACLHGGLNKGLIMESSMFERKVLGKVYDFMVEKNLIGDLEQGMEKNLGM